MGLIVTRERRRILRHLNQAVAAVEKQIAKIEEMLPQVQKRENKARLEVMLELKREELDNWHNFAEIVNGAN